MNFELRWTARTKSRVKTAVISLEKFFQITVRGFIYARQPLVEPTSNAVIKTYRPFFLPVGRIIILTFDAVVFVGQILPTFGGDDGGVSERPASLIASRKLVTKCRTKKRTTSFLAGLTMNIT